MTNMSLAIPARERAAPHRASQARPAQHGDGAMRRRGPADGAMAALSSAATRALRRAARRPARSLMQLAAFGVGLFIIVNAVGLQQARHPAPLGFARDNGAVASQPAERPPLPPVRPSDLAAASPAMAPAATPALSANLPRQAQPTMPASAAAPAQAARSVDPIGELIRGGDLPPASIPKTAMTPAREPARPVLAAQRALVKLGYTQVRPDGVPGDTTKAAIERFERERKLPVTGQLNPRTLRELAAASGLKLD